MNLIRVLDQVSKLKTVLGQVELMVVKVDMVALNQMRKELKTSALSHIQVHTTMAKRQDMKGQEVQVETFRRLLVDLVVELFGSLHLALLNFTTQLLLLTDIGEELTTMIRMDLEVEQVAQCKSPHSTSEETLTSLHMVE